MRNNFFKKFFGIASAAVIAATVLPAAQASAAQPGPVLILNDGTVADMSANQNVIVVSASESTEAVQASFNTFGTNGYRPADFTDTFDITIMPNGVIFDGGFYALMYPDVAAAVGTSHDALLSHYLLTGMNEGRLPNAGTGWPMVGQETLYYQINGVTYCYAPADPNFFTDGRIAAIGDALARYYGTK